MEEETKPFSEKLKNKYDLPAKLVAEDFMNEIGFDTKGILNEQKEQFEKYDTEYDFLGTTVTAEAEYKEGWTDRGHWQYNFPTIDVSYRKRYSEAHVFVMCNFHKDTIAVAWMKDVITSDTYCKKTKHTTWERFFKCNPKIFTIYLKKNGRWKKIN
jgi:hypothetical protein